MGRQKNLIYTESQWAAADPIDRMYMHLMEPDRWELSHQEDDMLEKLRMVWAIICKKSTQRERIRLISEQIVVSERTVVRYIDNAIHLFGDILKVDMDIELSLAYERYMLLFKKATKAKDFDAAKRCQDSAIAILEKIESRAPAVKKTYPAIMFTDDVKYLRSRTDGSEALEFEMIPENASSLLEQEADTAPQAG